MRSILPFLAALFIGSSAYAQCDAPAILDWSFSDDLTVNITVDSPEATDGYTFSFIALWDDFSSEVPDTITYTGPLSPGVQELSFSVESVFEAVESVPADVYYYEALMSASCGMDNSATCRFYVSPLSLLGEEGYVQSPLHYNPITFLPDGNGSVYNSTFEVPPSYEQESIDSIFVLIDIGHTYNGDLNIALISPSGTYVNLMEFGNGNGLGGSKGFSVLFKDGADSIEAIPSSSGNTVRGEYAPTQPLSTFVGELIAGTWTVEITDNLGADYGYLFGVGLYFNTSPCLATIGGKAFFDYDDNGTQDGTEPSYSYGALAGSFLSNTTYLNSAGTYARCVAPGSGVLGMIGLPQYYSTAPEFYTLDISEGDFFTDLNFALQADVDVTDISVDMFSLTPDRPGFENVYYVNYENIGTLCVDEFLLSVTLDDDIIINSVDDDEVMITGNTLTLTVNDLCPFQDGGFQIGITVPETIMIGDTLTSSVSATNLEQDIDSSNNSFLMENEVVGSYDPNDITVDLDKISPQYNGPTAELEYRIRFQNTGNYQAERVLIIDSLPEDLNIDMLTILDASHEMTVSSQGNVLYFDFQNIGLPDMTTDPIGSNGFVRFKVTNVGATEVGDVINNKAEIYFDFNAAIITNTAQTIVDESVLSLVDPSQIQVGLFPNPSTDILNIQWEQEAHFDRLIVVDESGRQVIDQMVTGQKGLIEISVSELAAGRYGLVLQGESFRAHQAFFKK